MGEYGVQLGVLMEHLLPITWKLLIDMQIKAIFCQDV